MNIFDNYFVCLEMAAYPDMVIEFIDNNKRILILTVYDFSNEFNLYIDNRIETLKNITITESNHQMVYNSILDRLFQVYDTVTLFYRIFNKRGLIFILYIK
jgi:hypothetical protein